MESSDQRDQFPGAMDCFGLMWGTALSRAMLDIGLDRADLPFWSELASAVPIPKIVEFVGDLSETCSWPGAYAEQFAERAWWSNPVPSTNDGVIEYLAIDSQYLIPPSGRASTAELNASLEIGLARLLQKLVLALFNADVEGAAAHAVRLFDKWLVAISCGTGEARLRSVRAWQLSKLVPAIDPAKHGSAEYVDLMRLVNSLCEPELPRP